LQALSFSKDLVFLVRDWSDTDVAYGFAGGNEYLLEKVLVLHKDYKDLASVRENIRDSFEAVKCFLMPMPGMRIMRRGAGQSAPTLAGMLYVGLCRLYDRPAIRKNRLFRCKL